MFTLPIPSHFWSFLQCLAGIQKSLDRLQTSASPGTLACAALGAGVAAGAAASAASSSSSSVYSSWHGELPKRNTWAYCLNIVPNSMMNIDQQYPIRTTLIISRVSNTIHIHTPKRAQTEFPLPHSQTPPQLWVQHLCWVRLEMAAYHRRDYGERNQVIHKFHGFYV